MKMASQPKDGKQAKPKFTRTSGSGSGSMTAQGIQTHGSVKTIGRPPKNGVKALDYFLRALKVIHAHSKARAGGQKLSAATRETVEFLRQLDPDMPISETTVKRVLAEFRSQESQVALTVDYSILEGEEAARHRSFHAQMLEFAGIKSTTELTDQDMRKPLKVFKFGFGKRPNYPRHNAKTSNP
jgi:hypothetical protein